MSDGIYVSNELYRVTFQRDDGHRFHRFYVISVNGSDLTMTEQKRWERLTETALGDMSIRKGDTPMMIGVEYISLIEKIIDMT